MHPIVLCAATVAAAAGVAVAVVFFLARAVRNKRVAAWAQKAAALPATTGAAPAVAAVVNPYGGSRLARKIHAQVLEPRLARAACRHSLLLTEAAGHGRALGSQLAAGEAECGRVDAVLSVGGDGLLNEVFNGMFAAALEEACEEGGWPSAERLAAAAAAEAMPALCAVPGGSMNGVALCMGIHDPAEALEALFGGGVTHTDLLLCSARYEGGEEGGRVESVLGAMHVSWAVVADHDVLHEVRLRSLGPTLKGLLAPLLCILRARAYWATLRFLPADTGHDRALYADYERHCLEESGEGPGWTAGGWRRPGERWRRLEHQRFALVTAANIPRASAELYLSPHVAADEGAFDLLVVTAADLGRLSYWEQLQLFLLFAEGRHVGHAAVQVYKARAFHLSRLAAGQSSLSVDGEVLATPTELCTRVVPRCLRMCARAATQT